MMQKNNHANSHASHASHVIVIGGSMAGLLAARVLSDHFAAVTILERDAVNDAPEARKGQPQARHLHALLAQGLQVMTHYFPDLVEGLRQEGAMIGDMSEHLRWFTYGGYRLQTKLGLQGAMMSRPLLEWQVRRRVLALPNVRLIDQCDVENLLFTADKRRVTGVRVTLRGAGSAQSDYAADLVIDAAGRGTAGARWLAGAGYAPPAESAIKVNIGYATRLYRRRPGDLEGAAMLIVSPEGPDDKRSGIAFPIEGDRWIVSLGGYNGDHPPLDEAGYLAFARTLPAPDIYNLLLKLEPISPIMPYKFGASLRRHYEKLQHFPEGYLVLGDAICSFNPVYGQGMTCAAMQAQLLDELLAHRSDNRGDNLHGLARDFFRRAAKIVDIPWKMAAGSDFRFRGTVGDKGASVNFINAYLARVHRATHHDPVVLEAFYRVMNLMQPPTALFHPKVLLRVLRPRRRADAAPVRMEAVEVSGGAGEMITGPSLGARRPGLTCSSCAERGAG
jgi:2-polyprenyl-6-methoxyphenol hydroxylase-like FAD-dependent oxidoreductase